MRNGRRSRASAIRRRTRGAIWRGPPSHGSATTGGTSGSCGACSPGRRLAATDAGSLGSVDDIEPRGADLVAKGVRAVVVPSGSSVVTLPKHRRYLGWDLLAVARGVPDAM